MSSQTEIRARQLLQEVADNWIIPDGVCSCHLSPPCSDCVENSYPRELLQEIHELLAKQPEPEQPKLVWGPWGGDDPGGGCWYQCRSNGRVGTAFLDSGPCRLDPSPDRRFYSVPKPQEPSEFLAKGES